MMFEPVVETKPALNRMFDHARSRSMLQPYKEPVRRLPQSADDLKGLSCALMTIAQRVRPARRIESQIEASLFSDITATANVGARLAVSQVQNGFVDAPAIRRRFE